jgi:hypothetical protein
VRQHLTDEEGVMAAEPTGQGLAKRRQLSHGVWGIKAVDART